MTSVMNPPPTSGTDPFPEPRELHDRYPGAPPFGDSDIDRLLFKGRDDEIDNILHQIFSTDLLLVYALSGSGKSSLLRAGIVHRLRERDFFPVIIRLNDPTRDPPQLIRDQINDAAAAAAGVMIVESTLASTPRPGRRALWDELNSFELWSGTTLLRLVLIFDQFEEIFTLWPEAARRQFVGELGEVIRGYRTPSAHILRESGPPMYAPSVKIVLAMREDFLGQLELVAADIPQILQHRFRLTGLAPAQAEAAIRRPAAVLDPRLTSPPFAYTDEAAACIVDFLAARSASPTPNDALIEPFQLQIICHHVERSILPTKPMNADGRPDGPITKNDLGGPEGLERILTDFYRREIDRFPEPERGRIRDLCETGLINANGRRVSLEEADVRARFRISEATVTQLVNRRLIRAESRLGSTYYELAHDTLVAPILAYRTEQRLERSRRTRRRLTVLATIVAVALGAAIVWRVASRSGADTTLPLRAGGRISDTIDVPGSLKKFPIALAVDETVVITVHPQGGLDPVIEVADTAGSRDEVDVNGEDVEETIVLTGPPSDAEDQWVTVRAYAASTGSFDLTIEPTTPRRLSPDAAGGGGVPPTEGDNLFTVTVREGESLAVDVKPDTGFDPRVRVVPPDGPSRIVNDGFVGERETLVLEGTTGQEGEYLVLVEGAPSSIGTFEIGVTPATVEPLVPGTPFVGEVLGPTDLHLFELEGGSETLVVEVAPDEFLDPLVEISATDTEATSVDVAGPGTRETFVLKPSPGGGHHYRIAVRGFGESTGAFSIRAQPLVLTEASEGELSGFASNDGSPMAYAITSPPDQIVAIDLSSRQSDVTFDVLAPTSADPTVYTGVQVGVSSAVLEGSADSNAPVLVVVTTTAEYSRSFDLNIRRVEAQTLSVGDIRRGEVGQASEGGVFVIDVPEGETFRLSVDPEASFNPMLHVVGPNGTGDDIDAGLAGTSEHITLGGLGTGSTKYRVIVRSVDAAYDETGAPIDPSSGTLGVFEISVDREPVQPLGRERVRYSVGVDRAEPIFRFTRSPGEVLLLEVTPEAKLDPAVKVSGAGGLVATVDEGGGLGGAEELLFDDSSFEAGAYQIAVGAYPYEPSRGKFGISLTPIEPEPARPGKPVTAELGNDHEVAVFMLEPSSTPRTVTVTTTEPSLNATARIIRSGVLLEMRPITSESGRSPSRIEDGEGGDAPTYIVVRREGSSHGEITVQVD